MEVGPLARWVIGYAQGKPEFKEPVEKVLKDLGLPVTALFSTLGRTAARGARGAMGGGTDALFPGQADRQHQGRRPRSTANVDKWEPETWPAEAKGVGFTEAPRGALGALDQDQGRQDRQLPVRRADDLERLARAIPRAISAPSRPR